MMRGAVQNILETVGHTPIVKLNNVTRHIKSEIYVKCEYLNPGGSMKDRVAINIVTDAERRGLGSLDAQHASSTATPPTLATFESPGIGSR